MSSLKDAIETAVSEYAATITGKRPVWKPSKKAHLASSSFLRENAREIAAALHARRGECRLFGAPLLASVTEENGWILCFFTVDAIDAFAATLPTITEPDDSYLNRRLWAMARRPDAKTPDDPALLSGFFALLFSAPDGAERFLSAPRAHDGGERIAIEQRLRRMATVLLFEQNKE